jgi:hypothetical protein
MKIKILSKKIGPDCIRNLYDRYQNNKNDKNMKELILETLIVFLENFARIIYEEQELIKQNDLELFFSKIDNCLKKLAKIKKESDIPGFIKYRIINLEEKRKNNFVSNKSEKFEITTMIKEINQKSKIEGKLTQEDINKRMKKELYNYKEYKKNDHENQNENILEQTTYILEMKKNFGEAFGDILEGYFISTSEILEDEKKSRIY